MERIALAVESAGAEATETELNLTTVVKALLECSDKRIYFANTVERLHRMLDLLEGSGFDMANVVVLHNRMPASWRNKAESIVSFRQACMKSIRLNW